MKERLGKFNPVNLVRRWQPKRASKQEPEIRLKEDIKIDPEALGRFGQFVDTVPGIERRRKP